MSNPIEMPRTASVAFVQVVTPLVNRPIRCRILSDRLIGYFTHWKGTTRLCKYPNPCPGCEDGSPRRWQTTLPVQLLPSGRPAIIQLGRAASHRLGILLQDKGRWRRWIVTLERKGNRKNGPVMCSLAPADTTGEEITLTIDVRETMMNLWGEENSLFH